MRRHATMGISSSIETNAISPEHADAVGVDAGELQGKPKTATVLGLLALASLTFSYLGAYAVYGALVSAEVVRPWAPAADPRPRWLAISFCVLLGTFVCIGALARQLSRRQLRKIDEMGEETGAPVIERPLRSSLTP